MFFWFSTAQASREGYDYEINTTFLPSFIFIGNGAPGRVAVTGPIVLSE
jgi:hypothetical protein